MEERTRFAITIAGAALALGLLADGLLRVTPWGLNAALWSLGLIAAIALLAARRVSPLMGEGRRMAIPALLFGASFAWRDSPTLKGLDGCAVALCLGLMAYRGRAGCLRSCGVWEYGAGVGRAMWESLTGSLTLLTADIGWERIPRGKWSTTLSAAGRGLLLALPLLLLFGWLLTSADAVFARYLTDLAEIDVQSGLLHIAVTIACAWAVAGYLHGLLLREERLIAESATDEPAPKPFGLGAVEIGTALTLLDLLFLIFVVVQVRYLFGGSELVQARAGLTYAQYARRGFFELVWAAALVLPLLLGAHALLDTSLKSVRRMFGLLSSVLVALLLVVLGSAAQRMRLYQTEYGLTELRFYTSAFMAWLAVLFVWFCATVLRGRRERFAYGALTTAMGVVLLLHAANPDALIARTNVARAREGKAFDAAHAAALSGDAVPVLVGALPDLAAAERAKLEQKLWGKWGEGAARDWRTWSVGRDQASEAVSNMRGQSPVVARLHGE